MVKIFYLLLAIIVNQSAFSQTKSQEIIEGGKFVLEAIKLFKKGDLPDEQPCENSICFENQTKNKLSVTLQVRSALSANPIKIMSSAYGRDCSYSVEQGIYHYLVLNEAGDTVRMAEAKLEVCSNLLIKISD